MACKEVFARFVARLKLSRTSPVAVAVSGGSDSLALTYLAAQTFNRVVGITIDNGINKGSYENSLKAREEIVKLGVEHRIIPLEWEETPPPGKMHMLTRERRYSSLLQQCQELDIRVLMFGHHQNDQTETFLLRLSKGSGIDGLSCMSPVVTRPGYPAIKIMRPLLECSKDSLVQLCRDNNLKWVEDSTNDSLLYRRNMIRKMFASHPDLHHGLREAVKLCNKARTNVHQEVMDAVNDVPEINETYGYVTADMDDLKQLPLPVIMRLLPAILMYTGGTEKYAGGTVKDISMKHLLRLMTLIRNPSTARAITFSNCIIFPMPEKRVFAFARQPLSKLPDSRHLLTPIQVGETVFWDNRFEVSLRPLEPDIRAKSRGRFVQETPTRLIYPSPIIADSYPAADAGQFFVRHMYKSDWDMARRGVRKIRGNPLPHEHVRGGLPVILDCRGKVVLIPHFRVIDRTAGVTCRVRFSPQRRIEDFLNSMETSDR